MLAISDAASDDLNAKLKALSIERGDSNPADREPISIVEKDNDSASEPPKLGEGDLVEGHRPRQVRFAEESGHRRNSDSAH